MVAEQYLERIKKLDTMLENKIRDYHRWLEVAEGLGGGAVGERVQTSRNLHQIPDAIGAYVDLDKEIDRLKQERMDIIKTIERLPPLEYDLIYRLYVQDQTLKELAFHFKKSYEWVKLKKRQAMSLVQHMLDEAQTSTERR